MEVRIDARFQSMILTVIEEEFGKTYGKPYEWKVLLRNSAIRKQYEEMNLLVSDGSDVSRFRAAIEHMLEHHDKYQWETEIDEKEPDKKIYKVKRRNNFKDVVDAKTLVKEVQKHPEGLLADE